MKKILALVAFLLVAAAAAHFLSEGGLPFTKSLTEDEQKIDELRSELRAAEGSYRQSGRAAAMSGMDTTFEASAALAEVDRIERELKKLKKKLSSEAALVAVRRLEDEIEDFRSEIR